MPLNESLSFGKSNKNLNFKKVSRLENDIRVG